MKENIQKYIRQFTSLLTLIGELAGLIIAIQANAHIWIVLFGFSLFLTIAYGLIYILYAKKPGLLSLDGNQRKIYIYPDTQRHWAVAGLLILVISLMGILIYPSGRTYVGEAFIGTATPSLGELAACPVIQDGETLILLAQFENINPNIGSYAVNETLIRALRGNLDEFSNVVFYPINLSIKEIQGDEYARALGESCNADLLLWGWYRMSSADSLDEVIVHFESFVDKNYFTPSSSYEVQTQIAQLDSFQLRLNLTQELTAFSLFIIGLAYIEQEDYELASQAFTHALKTDSWIADHSYNGLLNNDDLFGQEVIFFYRGIANQEGNFSTQAISDYSEAIDLNPNFYQAYINRGALYDNYLQDYNKAIADYNQAINLNPENSFVYYTNRGNSYRALGDYEQAISDYEQAISINSNFEHTYNSRGITYHDLGDNKKAIEDYNKAIAINANFTEAYYNRGNAYYSLEDYEQAVIDFTQAISLDIDKKFSFVFYEMRGNAYSSMGNYDKAVDDYNQSITLNPEYSEAYRERGDAYAYMGNYEQAVSDYTKAITLNPKDFMAYNNRGNVLNELGDTEQAISDYNEAVSIAPKYATAYKNLGSIYLDKKDYEQAIFNFTKAIVINPEYASVYFVRGLAYNRTGEYEKSIADFRKLTQLQPNNIVTWNSLCWWGSLMGKADEVLVACDKAVTLADTENLPSVADSRGIARALTGDFDGAIKDFQLYIDSNNICDDSCALRKEWVIKLQAGINPFDEKMLEYLMNE